MKNFAVVLVILLVIVAASLALLTRMQKGLPGFKEGEMAPDFTFASSAGGDFTLSKELKKSSVVLYFYPKDFTKGCTAEACAFRDSYEVFKKAGAQVVGVSSDPMETHKKFIKEDRLPFILLSDEKQELRKLYRVPTSGGVIPGRVTFVIDKAGVIRYVYNSQFEAVKHTTEALRILEEIGKKK